MFAMIKRKDRIAYFISSFVESLVTAVSFGLAYLIRKQLPAPLFGLLFPFSDYLVLLLVIIGLWNLLFALIRAQRAGRAEDPFDIVKEVGLTVILGSVLISTAIFFFKLEFISRPLIALFSLLNFLLLCGFRIFVKAKLSQFQSLIDGEKNVLIVGTGDRAADLLPVLEDAQKWGYRIVGVVRESEESLVNPRLLSHPILELSRMSDVLRNHVVDEAIFAVSKETLA